MSTAPLVSLGLLLGCSESGLRAVLIRDGKVFDVPLGEDAVWHFVGFPEVDRLLLIRGFGRWSFVGLGPGLTRGFGGVYVFAGTSGHV